MVTEPPCIYNLKGADHGDDHEWDAGLTRMTDHPTKPAPAPLLAGDELYRLMVAGAEDYAFFALTPDNRVASWNAGARRLFGYSAEEIIGRPGADLFVPEDRTAGIPEGELRAAQEQGRAEVERRYLRKDGSGITVSGVCYPLRDRSGTLAGFAKVCRAITRRGRAESDRVRPTEEVEADGRRLNDIFRLAPSLMAVVRGPEHVFEWANERYRQLIGHRELIGRPAREVLPELQGQGFFELLDRVYRTGEPFVGTDVRVLMRPAPDGPPDERFMDFVYQPIREPDGRVSGILAQGVDLTERKRAEERLREGEERFRLMADAIPTIVWITDAEGRTEFLNRQWSAYTGAPYEPSTAAEVAERFVHPDDGPPTLAAFEEARRAGAPFRVEHRIRSAAGEYRWFLVRAEPHRDPATGAVVRWFGTSTDIHDAKLAEERLREGEERYRTLFTSIDEGFCVIEMLFDADGRPSDYRFLEMNPAFEKHTGLSGALGRTARELLPGLEAHWFETYGRVARTGEPVRFVNEAKTMAGRWFDVYAFRLGEPQQRRVALIFTDITERKRAEAELRAKEERVRLATDAAELGIWVWHVAEDRATWENDRLYEIFGLPRTDEPINVARFMAEFLDPADVPELRRAIARTLETGARYHFVGRFRRPDGEPRWVEFTGKLVRAADGTPAQIIGTAADITDRRRAEDELREADRRKNEFLAMLAHELRNPLSGIAGAIRLARRPGQEGQVPYAHEVIERQAGNLARLIDDLLDVSRITQGKVELKREVVDVPAAIHRAAEAVRPLIEQRRHELTVRVTGGPMHVDADPTRLEQIVANLLTNAAKYTEEGGRITASGRTQGGEVVIAVADNGIGIAPEMLPRVFELFTQVDRTLARSEGGLGIGLTLVQRLVELHGGTISAASEPGKGSEFTVRLPLVAEAPEAAGPGDGRVVPVRGMRLLIVDDNADTARLTGRLLRAMGFTVQVVHDGRAAVEAARRHRPEVVLLDIGLPGLDGFEVARRLRREECCRDALIVGVSGYGDAEARERGREAGFDHHLVKPVDVDALVSLIGRAADRE